MHVEQISNVDALFGMLALIAFGILVFRIVPLQGEPPRPSEYAEADVAAHDWALPKYMIVTTLALVIGALHLAARSVPAVADWLAQGGYGGHLLRDIAYSHMMIVMGGTIAVTGLTWYCLPRVLRRPLYSSVLAEAAFWATVVGSAGFYLSNAMFGGAMASMINGGASSAQVDDAIGIWRNLVTGLSATVMGIGYWTYVANVYLTALGKGKVPGPRPHRNLAKFFIIGASGLLVGTIQGVLQVLPDNIDWLHSAGQAGRYIDPLSHAHVNLITGVVSIIAGTVFFLTRRTEGRRTDMRAENVVFWTLVGGSVSFYLSFLLLGFREGQMIVGGMSFSQAKAIVGALHTLPLALSGGVMFLGLWLFIGLALRRMFADSGKGRLMFAFGSLALCLGTLQGLTQVMPPVRTWMLAAGPAGGAIADAHAQINIVGGVLLMLLGAMISVGKRMTGCDIPASVARRTSLAMGSGALLYYAAAIGPALWAAFATNEGVSPDRAAGIAAAMSGPAEILGALLYAGGAATMAWFVWEATRQFREDGWERFKLGLAQNNSSAAPWRRKIPMYQLIVPELLVGVFGFPGLGWVLSGRAMIGVPLMMGGAAVSWAIIPLLISPYGDGRLPHLDPANLEIYLGVSALISSLVLSMTLFAAHARRKSATA